MPACIEIPSQEIIRLSQKWEVRRLALFGSVLREDFRADSDIDVLVQFRDGAPWSLWDILRMKEELEVLFGRPVDMVEQEGLRNPWRREEILRTCEVIYAA